MRRTTFISTAAFIFAGALAACGQQPAEPAAEAPAAEAPAAASTATAFENVRLIIGDGTVIENGVLVIDGTTIVDVGAPDDTPIPEGATRIDATGQTIMPAIVDTHVHMRPTRDELIQDLSRRAYFGIGAATSLGRDPDELLPMRDERIPGAARFFSSGRGITGNEPGRPTEPFWVDTVEEARAAVQELAPLNVDMIKIWVDDRNGEVVKLTPELYTAIIEEAHANNVRVIAHIFSQEDGLGLINAGVDAFAHGVRDSELTDEYVAAYMARPELFIAPNLPDRGAAVDLAWLQAALPAETFAELAAANVDNADQQSFHAVQARNLNRLYQAGATIGLGTDGNAPWAAHLEMEDMVLAGMSPGDVIVAATRNSAAFLRMDDAGTLENVKSADFIVLDANPLDDITNTRAINAVYLRGEAVDRTAYP
jgi:imidazolonepropionase-like amidohydrolase